MKCENDLYPQHNGKECLCADCNTLIGCPKCAICEGPIKDCDPLEEVAEEAVGQPLKRNLKLTFVLII